MRSEGHNYILNRFLARSNLAHRHLRPSYTGHKARFCHLAHWPVETYQRVIANTDCQKERQNWRGDITAVGRARRTGRGFHQNKAPHQGPKQRTPKKTQQGSLPPTGENDRNEPTDTSGHAENTRPQYQTRLIKTGEGPLNTNDVGNARVAVLTPPAYTG